MFLMFSFWPLRLLKLVLNVLLFCLPDEFKKVRSKLEKYIRESSIEL